mgnify:FL=1
MSKQRDIHEHIHRETVLPFASGGPARDRFTVSIDDEYERFDTWEEACAFYYTFPNTFWIIVLRDDGWDTPLYERSFTSYEDAWDFLYNKFPKGEDELDEHAVILNGETP